MHIHTLSISHLLEIDTRNSRLGVCVRRGAAHARDIQQQAASSSSLPAPLGGEKTLYLYGGEPGRQPPAQSFTLRAQIRDSCSLVSRAIA